MTLPASHPKIRKDSRKLGASARCRFERSLVGLFAVFLDALFGRRCEVTASDAKSTRSVKHRSRVIVS